MRPQASDPTGERIQALNAWLAKIEAHQLWNVRLPDSLGWVAFYAARGGRTLVVRRFPDSSWAIYPEACASGRIDLTVAAAEQALGLGPEGGRP